ncbi:hypothetical protein LTR41_000736 [Exophiala xenobiotica]|nr:hypothetical protein LTR41_000736 [Exophiala xenobiotica]KAK5331464.1 hypothetical protein LTR93_000467 [Exophiala xenobiotica]
MAQTVSLNIPRSSQTCQLSIINTTCDITVPPPWLVEPKINGYDWLNLPTYSFHLKHASSGTEVLFDLGGRKDWENFVPKLSKLVRERMPGLRITKDVVDILPEGSVDITDIQAAVLSHHHWDHVGAPAHLPKSVRLVVGPGFREAFLPGYPAKEDSEFHEADFEGREVVEVAFSDDLKIGEFQAHDYFGDGSFYILNVPGHAIGHVSGLVRTTPDTFVFLGGDVCHHGGVIRPTKSIPLPDEIPEEAVLDKAIPRPCLCTAFLSSHPDQANGRTTPFLKVTGGPESWYRDPETSRKSVQALEEFDADPNVLVVIAHDPTSLEVFDFFPNGSMNDWQKNGWKQASHWGFLSEIPYNGKTVRPTLVDGLYDKDGKKLRGLDL